jgi:hypothetical protein
VRFECELDLGDDTSRCNCSICGKGRFWKAIVAASDFRSVQGEDALACYQFGSKNIRHLFCSTCGVKPFGRGEMPGMGPFVAIHVGCLEASDDELAAAPLTFQDGKNDRWDRPPAETRHL